MKSVRCSSTDNFTYRAKSAIIAIINLREYLVIDTSFILLIKQAEWSYMTDKIPCSSGISLLPQGIYLCYKPLFDC